MITPLRVEAQVVYFDLIRTFQSGVVTENWSYLCLPITQDHLETAPILPDNCRENFDETQRKFLGYLKGLYDEGGDMAGWKAHSIEGPTGHPTIDGIRAKVIQAREQAHSIESPKGHLTLKGLRAELAQARELRKSSPESKELPLRPAARS